jgi:hypothetical protein
MVSSDPFEPDSLRLPTDESTQVFGEVVQPCRKRKVRGKHLQGPVPWDWLLLASRLPGKALAVGLILWFWANALKKKVVRYRPAQVRALGVHPCTARRGLQALADAGLVSIHYPPGRCLEVTILDLSLRGMASE